jgi:hypothetical protein
LVPTELEGRVYYDQDEQALTVYSGIADTSLQIGQEQLFYIKNNSGITINTGQVVMLSGSLGASGRLTGQLADQTKVPSSVYVMGVASNTMSNGEDGFVATFGKIKGIDATGTSVGETWNDGDILYIHPTIPGALTNQLPPEGSWKLIIAAVIHNTVNGTIFVRLTPANNIGELDNVNDVNSTNGDLLVKYGLGWENTKQLSGSYGITGSIDIVGDLIINGTSYTAATSGTSGSSGTSGESGTSGTTGTSGESGTSGTTGTSGANGTSGTGFSTINNASLGRIILSDGTTNAATASSNLTYLSGVLNVTGSTVISVTGSSMSSTTFNVLTLTHPTTGTATSSFGVGMQFVGENNSGTSTNFGSLEYKWGGVDLTNSWALAEIKLTPNTVPTSSKLFGPGIENTFGANGMYTAATPELYDSLGVYPKYQVYVRQVTTDATETPMVFGTFDNRAFIPLPNDTTWLVTAYIVARKANFDDTSAGYWIRALIDNNANVIAMVGQPQVQAIEDDVTYNATIDAGSGTGLRVVVKGQTGHTVRWNGWVDIVQVSG